MSAHKLVHILRVDEVAHLTTSVDPVKRLAGQCVPETDAPICCSSSTAHCSVLVRGPSDGFNRSNMLVELGLWLHVVCLAPYH